MKPHIVAGALLVVLLFSVVVFRSSSSQTGSVPTGSTVVESSSEYWPGVVLVILAIFTIAFFVIKPSESRNTKNH